MKLPGETRQIRLFLSLVLIIAGALLIWQGARLKSVPPSTQLQDGRGRLNFNVATREQLLEVDIFYPQLVDSALSLRQKRGYFRKEDDLLQIYGVDTESLPVVLQYIFY